MSFSPNKLPNTVKKAYELGPLAWVHVIRTAINVGMRDLDELADIAFYLHYPDLKGRPLKVGETELVEQWVSLRSLIKPILNSIPDKTSELTIIECNYFIYKLHSMDANGNVVRTFDHPRCL